MKKYLLLLLLFCAAAADAQRRPIDSIKAVLEKTPADSSRINILIDLGNEYSYSNADSCILFEQQAFELAQKYNRVKDQARSLNNMAIGYSIIGDFAKALQIYYQVLKVYESINDVVGIARTYNNIGSVYATKGDYKSSLPNLLIAKNKFNSIGHSRKLTFREKTIWDNINLNIGEDYLYLKKLDSAEFYLQACYKNSRMIKDTSSFNAVEHDLGEVEAARGNKTAALERFNRAVAISITLNDADILSVTYLGMANLYHKNKQQDSARYYAHKALEVATKANFQQDVLNASKALYTFYDEDQNASAAYKYFKIATAAKDSLYNQEKVKQLLSIDFDEKQRQRDVMAAKIKVQNNIRIYSLIAGVLVLLLLVFVFWRNSVQRAKANLQLQKQKEEIESTLVKLKLTQNQLIQSEKMASLGELTAGIAHEIQNPLNFVNNFSEVSAELTQELKEELKSGNTEEAMAIADDLEQNLDKIKHHGKRADFIVKGMLQHSNTGTGERMPTNINALTDEFLKLAYNNQRKKEKSFSANIVTNFDEKLPLVTVTQQDIGRVLVNLFNNAFYAIHQKQKTTDADYKPELSVTTFAENGQVVIKVKDNGTGIPDTIKDKIMQPFFTTKPTGEGTGLGLSLTYDMVVKGHGGNIQVNSVEGEGSEFVIILPLH